jgi:hypothetical protein
MKTFLVIAAFAAIVGSLGAALYFMMRPRTDADGQPRPNHMAKALAVRVGLSIVLFLCILVAWKLGYLRPTGIPAGA